MNCTRNQFFLESSGTLVAEASDLGLPAGRWPNHLSVDGSMYERSHPERDHEGELRAMHYRPFACDQPKVVIVND